MPNWSFTGEAAAAADILPKLAKLNARLDQWRPLCAKLSLEQLKKLYMHADSPILDLAWKAYKNTYEFFGGVDPNDI